MSTNKEYKIEYTEALAEEIVQATKQQPEQSVVCGVKSGDLVCRLDLNHRRFGSSHMDFSKVDGSVQFYS